MDSLGREGVKNSKTSAAKYLRPHQRRGKYGQFYQENIIITNIRGWQPINVRHLGSEPHFSEDTQRNYTFSRGLETKPSWINFKVSVEKLTWD